MTSNIKTPLSLSAVARANHLGIKAGSDTPAPSLYQARAALALNAQRPVNSSGQVQMGQDQDGSVMQLSPHKIAPYEHNPRTTSNPKYQSIRDSIEAQGLNGSFPITKRPGGEHYILCAGWNTRLRIVQELHQEFPDDPRFKYVPTVYKAWPGEAALIARHLSENETHGETTFWEKAGGMLMLKNELEKASGKPLSATDLNKEAASLGMQFGVTAVQNFMFASENLTPIGPWLSGNQVKETIRPTITALSKLCERLGVSNRDLRAEVAQVLTSTGAALLQRSKTESDLELDTEALVQNWNKAISKLLKVDQKLMPVLLSTLDSFTNMSGADLMAVATGKRPKTDPNSNASHVDGSDESNSQFGTSPQGLLLDADASTNQSPRLTPQQQMPLSPAMLGVAAEPKRKALEQFTTPNQLDISPSVVAQAIQDILKLIIHAANLGDVVCSCEAMPLGYFVELPEPEHALSQTPMGNSAALRKAAWHAMATLSGQFDKRLMECLPMEAVWRQLYESGELSSAFEKRTGGSANAQGWQLGIADVYTFFWDPKLGHLFLQLWSCVNTWRSIEPERFIDHINPIGIDDVR
jgi:ParB family protein of integrating conjugative element (PFGI_1 class)